MSTKWKIFRIANIVAIFLIASMIAIALYSGNFSFDNSYDILGYSIFMIAAIIIIGNCFSNILAIRFITSPENFSFTRKLLFCFFGILAFLMWAVLMIAIIIMYSSFEKLNNPNEAIHLGMIFVLCWGVTIGIIGLYIFFQQITLFLKIKRCYTEINTIILTEIGRGVE